MALSNDTTVIASDVNEQDGIGVEIYRDNKLVVEILRDDTLLTRMETVFDKEVALDLLEEGIAIFKKEIPWDFINYEKLSE